jgi:DNA modification methylase
MVAQQLGHPAIGIDLVAEYHDIALRRMSDAPLPFGEESA